MKQEEPLCMRVCGKGWMLEYHLDTGFVLLSGEDGGALVRIVPGKRFFLPEESMRGLWIRGRTGGSADDRYDYADERVLAYSAEEGEACVLLYCSRFPEETVWEVIPEPSTTVQDACRGELLRIRRQLTGGGEERYILAVGNRSGGDAGRIVFAGGWQQLTVITELCGKASEAVKRLSVHRDARKLLDELPAESSFAALLAWERRQELQIAAALERWEKEGNREPGQTDRLHGALCRMLGLLNTLRTEEGVFRAPDDLAVADLYLSGLAAGLLSHLGLREEAAQTLRGMRRMIAWQGFPARAPLHRRLTRYERQCAGIGCAGVFLEAALSLWEPTLAEETLLAWEHLRTACTLPSGWQEGAALLGQALSRRLSGQEIGRLACPVPETEEVFAPRALAAWVRAANLCGEKLPHRTEQLTDWLLSGGESAAESIEKLLCMLQS